MQHTEYSATYIPTRHLPSCNRLIKLPLYMRYICMYCMYMQTPNNTSSSSVCNTNEYTEMIGVGMVKKYIQMNKQKYEH